MILPQPRRQPTLSSFHQLAGMSGACRRYQPTPVPCGYVIEPSLDPVGAAEIEFRQIPVQMRLGHVLVDAIDATLQDGKVAFRRVRIGIIPDILFRGVIDGLISTLERAAFHPSRSHRLR
jgi:hypothetical protein